MIKDQLRKAYAERLAFGGKAEADPPFGAIGFLAALSGLLHGYILVHLWAWFVVPLGVPPLAYPQALGLFAIWLLAGERPVTLKKLTAPHVFARFFGVPASVWAAGYILHRCMP